MTLPGKISSLLEIYFASNYNGSSVENNGHTCAVHTVAVQDGNRLIGDLPSAADNPFANHFVRNGTSSLSIQIARYPFGLVVLTLGNFSLEERL